jgi:hypothetical protein
MASNTSATSLEGSSPLSVEQQMLHLYAKLKEIQQQNVWLKEKLERTVDRHVEEHGAHTKEPRISLPEKFDGTRSEYRGFINQVKLIISLHPSRYSSDKAKVGLVGTLLSKTAQAWFAPLVEKDSPLLNDFNEFLKEFGATFGDPDRNRTAALKLRNLRQGSRPAASYAADFRQLACDVPWGEDALVDQFRSGLSSEVKDLMLSLPDVFTLSEIMAQAVRCDNRLFE